MHAARNDRCLGPQSEHVATVSCPYMFASRTRARVPFGTSFASHAYVHAYESAYAFIFIATRFCLPFLPNCCKCDIRDHDEDDIFRRIPNENLSCTVVS